MGCIRVDKITEYLCEPLRKCLKDEDPYVRKTAAVSVAKLFDINAQLVEEQGFLDSLKELLSDSNPMVVANAVAALSEINEASQSGQPLIEMNTATINKVSYPYLYRDLFYIFLSLMTSYRWFWMNSIKLRT